MSETTITALYDALRRLDAPAMEALYAPDAIFDDPIYSLDGREQISGMWHMMIESIQSTGADVWRLDVTGVTDTTARWEPHYRFSGTGRMVHNRIESTFTFTDDGLIASQEDAFSLWRWSRQAVGLMGAAFGWTPILRKMVRGRAATNLEEFLDEVPQEA